MPIYALFLPFSTEIKSWTRHAHLNKANIKRNKIIRVIYFDIARTILPLHQTSRARWYLLFSFCILFFTINVLKISNNNRAFTAATLLKLLRISVVIDNKPPVGYGKVWYYCFNLFRVLNKRFKGYSFFAI